MPSPPPCITRKRSRELSSCPRPEVVVVPQVSDDNSEEKSSYIAVVDNKLVPLRQLLDPTRLSNNPPHLPPGPGRRIPGFMGPPVAQPLSHDSDGHIFYRVGDGLAPNTTFPQGRYRILGLLGEGTFGKVLKCWDYMALTTVAIKVVRAIPKYREAARIELEVLNNLGQNDPDDWHHCVKLLSWFEYRGHVCMTFEKLGLSLYDVLRQRDFRPFSLAQVRDYAWQLLESVQFVHSLALIHTDLKPENILHDDRRSTSKYAAIKLIDFGSATFDFWKHNDIISTRHYRAPEVILGSGWTYSCDLWSVGCILVELFTGEVLFQTHDDLEHLALMNALLGPIPSTMTERVSARSRKKFFRTEQGGGSVLNWPDGASSPASLQAVQKMRPLGNIVAGNGKQESDFLDLLTKLVAFEPAGRFTPAKALRHPFLQSSIDSEMPNTPSSGSSVCGVESPGLPLFSRKCLVDGASRKTTGSWPESVIGGVQVEKGTSSCDSTEDRIVR